MRFAATLLSLLFAAVPASAGTASVYYFDHSYRISFDISQAVEDIINSTSAYKLERVITEKVYTNGAKFLLEGPEDLSAAELNATTSYTLLEEAGILEGGTSLLLPPKDLVESFAPLLEEEMRVYLSVERRQASILEGLSPSGIKFKVLEIPDRDERALWEPTLKLTHLVSAGGARAVFTSLSIPMGLGGLNRRFVEEAADKRSAVMLSLGAGSSLAGMVMKAGPGRTFDYMAAAGTDIAALDYQDLRNFWTWSQAGAIKVSSSTPEFFCTNLKVTDPELAKLIKPYALREIGGYTVAFISLIPSRSAALADLAGAPYEIIDPKDQNALFAVINELRRVKKAKVVIAVSYLGSDEFGWLLGARGIDALIGPKTWDAESGRRTRVELRKWDKESHTAPALTVYPDARGAGVLRLEFGPRGALTALEGLPPPEDRREPLLYREQVYMKERIARYFLGSGDGLLPDLRGVGADYTIPGFFNLAASLARKAFRSEVAVVKVRPFSSKVLGDIPTAMVKTWLGTDEPMELALVPGFFLSGLLQKAPPPVSPGSYSPQAYEGGEYYAVSGVDKNGRVAGLPINPSETYLTALPASLAAGKPFVKLLRKRPGLPGTLHETVVGALDALKNRIPARQLWEAAALEETRNITPPRNTWRLNLRSLSLQLVNTEVKGPGGYASVNESRLSAVNQTMFQGSGRLFSEVYSEKFRFDAGISADYGRTALRPKGQPHLTTESADQLTYESELIYRMKKFNGRLGQLVIGPYASAAYDTEFSRAEGMPLRKVVRGGGGFKLFEGAAIQELYLGLSTEQVYTYVPERTKFAMETGFRLGLPLPGTALQLDADGNYRLFARSRFDTVYDLKERLELNLKLSTRLYGDIMISPFLKFFLATGKKLPGSASNLTTGFALEYSRLFKIKR
ncbi:MAG: hypothetical protein A2X32_00385 [Elusimicrobia bacterium GWC2_64_44]|nr:MAG: hypothetical protein A2X32_00385 [Elusimicrobia bacterium GWC2_64_44]